MRKTALILSLTLTIPAQAALIVDRPLPESPAEAAGLESGDRFVRLAGKRVVTMADLGRVLQHSGVGQKLTIEVERDGERLELPIVLGERDGRASLGVRLSIVEHPDDGDTPAPPEARQCLDWVQSHYRVDELAAELAVEIAETRHIMKTCVTRDMQRVPPERAVAYCPNIFKVHCQGMELLDTIGEALVERCATTTEVDRSENAWRICAQHRVYDAYVKEGQVTPAESCAAVLADCRSNVVEPSQ